MNPELRRNLWLEFSLHRVIAVPVVIALVIMLIVASGGKDTLESISGFASMGYAAVVLLWGTQLAGMSVIEEAQARTWDAQRMSAIGPWAMTWGKLFGAPSFAWYSGAILLVVFLVAGWTTTKIPIVKFALVMVISALMLHAAALTGSVYAARKGVARRGTGLLILVLVLFLLMISATRVAEQFGETMRWWRISFSNADFALASVCAYACWAVLGAYSAMCNELEIRTLPWALPAFIVFSAVFLAGFPANARLGGDLATVMIAGVMLSMAFTYLMLFGEASGAAVWQRLHTRVRAEQWKRASQELPVWMVALAVGLVFAVAAIATPYPFKDASKLQVLGFAPLGLTLYAVRDAAILQFFALARRPRRVEAATLFYLMLLYLLIPGLLSVMNFDLAVSVVRPPVLEQAAWATAIIGVQAAIAIALAAWRWRTIHALDVEATPRG